MLEENAKTPAAIQTVGNFLYDCLSNEGITEIFGVPGDYNFPLLDILERYENIKFINCRNELNAGYAADGYSRVKGIASLITTFGVGELSACNAVAGSYSESVPVIHIVGAPKTMVQAEHKKMHHTLLDGDFDVFRKMYEHVSEYTTIITSENAQIEIPKAIAMAKERKKPVYLLIAIEVVEQPVVITDIPTSQLKTNQKTLGIAVNNIKGMLQQSQKPVLISGVHVLRHSLQPKVQEIVEKMNIPAATMMMGKGSFDESHKNYIGLYAGKWGSQEVQNIVETSDCILAVGTIWTDNNTGSFTANIDPVKTIEIQPDHVKVGMAVYENILMADMLEELSKIAAMKSTAFPRVGFPYDQNSANINDNISAKYYYPRFQQFLKENDIVIAETGTFSLGLSQLKLPKGVNYITQAGWGSIGYATPAALGASLAAKERRVILFTGDGAHQFTVQELSSMINYNCRVVIFLLKNNFYTIEAYINTPEKADYNSIPSWDYIKLAEAFGGSAFTARVYTNRELDEAIKKLEEQWKEKLCLVEINATQMDAPDMLHTIHQMVEQMELQK